MAFMMRLDGLELTNFHKFERFSIDFDERMTVLVGENGSGKSSVLDAARIALDSFTYHFVLGLQRRIEPTDARVSRYGMGGITDRQEQYPVIVAARGFMGEGGTEQIAWSRSLGSPDDREYSVKPDGIWNLAEECKDRIKAGDTDLVLPVLAFYGTGRLWASEGKFSGGAREGFSRQDGYRGALDATAGTQRMLDWFYKMTAQDVQRAQSIEPQGPNPLFAAVRGAVERCFMEISGCERVNVTYNLDVNDLDVEYRESDGSVQRLSMSRLSDGYRTTLSLFADIAYRMALLNPALGERVLETPGVVLIDEVDLHLHPRWQARILGDLCAVFPNVQFIVTSHAPMVISSVSKKQVRILGEDCAYAPMRESYGLAANDVLTGIMGAGDRQPKVRQLLDEFARHFDVEDFDSAERTLGELERLVGADNPDVVAARSALVFERL